MYQRHISRFQVIYSAPPWTQTFSTLSCLTRGRRTVRKNLKMWARCCCLPPWKPWRRGWSRTWRYWGKHLTQRSRHWSCLYWGRTFLRWYSLLISFLTYVGVEAFTEASEAALKAVVDELQLPFGLFDWQVVFIRLIISISALGRFLRWMHCWMATMSPPSSQPHHHNPKAQRAATFGNEHRPQHHHARECHLHQCLMLLLTQK